MGLVLGGVVFVITIAACVVIVMADGMSDAPSTSGVSSR